MQSELGRKPHVAWMLPCSVWVVLMGWALGWSPGVQAQQPVHLALCVACHGPAGNSQNPTIPSLASQPKTFLENQLVLIRDGLRNIPSMKGVLDGLQDPELTALAQYFSVQAAVPMAGAVDQARMARGQALARTMLCGTCHLPDYAGRDHIPRLAGQQERFLRNVMQEYRDAPGPGRDTAMTAALYGLNDQQLDDLAHYLAYLR
jgi:cytochrome c553